MSIARKRISTLATTAVLDNVRRVLSSRNLQELAPIHCSRSFTVTTIDETKERHCLGTATIFELFGRVPKPKVANDGFRYLCARWTRRARDVRSWIGPSMRETRATFEQTRYWHASPRIGYHPSCLLPSPWYKHDHLRQEASQVKAMSHRTILSTLYRLITLRYKPRDDVKTVQSRRRSGVVESEMSCAN